MEHSPSIRRRPIPLPFSLWLWPLAPAAFLELLIGRNATARIALLSLLFIALPLFSLRFYGFSHYIAAWTAPALLFIIQGARQIFAWKRRLAANLRWLTCAAGVLLAAWPIAATAREIARGAPQWLSFAWVLDQEQVRADLADLAQRSGHKQLALIVYPPDHDPHAEWIYNSPDPGAQDVLWLRALGPARVPELAKIFPGYDEWLIYVKADGHFDHRAQIQLPPAPNSVSRP